MKYRYSRLRICFSCDGTGYYSVSSEIGGAYGFVSDFSTVVKCSRCNGSGKAQVLDCFKRLPKWFMSGCRLMIHCGVDDDLYTFWETLKCAFLYDLGWTRVSNTKDMN